MFIEIHLIKWIHNEIHFTVDLSLWAEVESLRPTGTEASWAEPVFGWSSLLLGPSYYIPVGISGLPGKESTSLSCLSLVGFPVDLCCPLWVCPVLFEELPFNMGEE